MPTTELTYHGRPLIDQPTNITLGDVATQLLAGRTVCVVLEPGDITRYCLILAPVFDDPTPGDGVITELAVVRTTGCGGDFRSAAVLPYGPTADEYYVETELRRLAGRNEWTFDLFRWWFARLWERLDAA